MISPTSVLFACTYNAARSPIAASLLKSTHGAKVFIDSAGTREGELDPFAVVVMSELGIDLEGHHCKTFDDLQDRSYDLVIALSPEAHERAAEFVRGTACELEFWRVIDPNEIEGTRAERVEAYRFLRDELRRRIKARFPS